MHEKPERYFSLSERKSNPNKNKNGARMSSILFWNNLFINAVSALLLLPACRLDPAEEPATSTFLP